MISCHIHRRTPRREVAVLLISFQRCACETHFEDLVARGPDSQGKEPVEGWNNNLGRWWANDMPSDTLVDASEWLMVLGGWMITWPIHRSWQLTSTTAGAAFRYPFYHTTFVRVPENEAKQHIQRTGQCKNLDGSPFWEAATHWCRRSRLQAKHLVLHHSTHNESVDPDLDLSSKVPGLIPFTQVKRTWEMLCHFTNIVMFQGDLGKGEKNHINCCTVLS